MAASAAWAVSSASLQVRVPARRSSISVYVPATSMPGWLQPFAKYQPITPMVDAVRSLILGSTSDVVLALAWSALLLAVFMPIAVSRYTRG